MNKIIFLGPHEYHQYVQARLPDFNVVLAQNEDDVLEHIEESIAIFDAYMRVPFQEALLGKAQNLQLFITATTGVSHIDVNILEKKSIPLLTLRGQDHIIGGLTAAAEHSWHLLMSLTRNLPAARQEVLNGGWDRNMFPGRMLKGKTLGIIGCGRIGQWMARYANAFGMQVFGFDAIKEPDDTLFTSSSVDDLLRNADFISLHIPYSQENYNFLSTDKLSITKRGVCVVNTSRGEILDENALLQGLKNGHIAGAALDVLRAEPYIDKDPLVEYARTHNNLIITPHIGGLSPEALEIVLDFSCKRINKHFAK